VCDLETSRIGAPYIYIYICDISSLRVNGPSEPGRLRDVCVCQWVKELKQLGRGVDYPPKPRAKVKERVELYLYSPFGSSWPLLWLTLPLLLLLLFTDY